VLVFECENNYTRDTNWFIELRNALQQDFNTERVYHTFMVRCHPKACAHLEGCSCFPPGKMLDCDETCILTKRTCVGIPIKPLSEEIINCLTYLLEELGVLRPDYAILFGQRVSDYVLKSCGIFEPVQIGQAYKYEDITILTTVVEKSFNRGELQKLGAIIEKL
jgi:uracil-DNA glycosylase